MALERAIDRRSLRLEAESLRRELRERVGGRVQRAADVQQRDAAAEQGLDVAARARTRSRVVHELLDARIAAEEALDELQYAAKAYLN